MSLPIRLQEEARIAALQAYKIMNSEPEAAFNRIARVLSQVFDVPVALVTFIDRDTLWAKAAVGATESFCSPRFSTFCNMTIASNQPLIVPDATHDSRFDALPCVAGEPGYRFYAGMPLRTAEGFNIGTLCCFDYQPRVPSERQIAALHDLCEVVVDAMELRLAVSSDGLTGVLRRNAFLEAAERDISLAVRHGRPLSCLVIDLDRFKAVNDTYGHAAGDQVLRGFALCCRGHLRDADYLGRLGGEEFGLILRETALPDAFCLAERLRNAVAQSIFVSEGTALSITASFGLAAVTAATSSAATLLAAADAALYRAKAGGRDRVAVQGASEGTARSAARARVADEALPSGIMPMRHAH